MLSDGLVLRSQNRWPTLRFDLASLLQAGGGLFGAGFYYKTFIWPSWRTLRGDHPATGRTGRGAGRRELPAPSIEHLSCDVLVGGAGAAGLAAALAAARAGARVVVCEREPECGGELEFEGGAIDGQPAPDWIACGRSRARAARRAGADRHHGRRRIGRPDRSRTPNRAACPAATPCTGSGRARFVVAMGAVERPIAFFDNDRPGVMLLGAAER